MNIEHGLVSFHRKVVKPILKRAICTCRVSRYTMANCSYDVKGVGGGEGGLQEGLTR